MEGSFGLVRIETDFSHLDGLRYGLDDVRLASALKALNLTTRLYSGQSAGRLQDLVRQLARMRTDHLLFWVSPDTLSAAVRLTTALRQLRPQVGVLWWGPASSGMNTVESLAAHAPEEVLHALECLGFITVSPAVLPSPYLTGLVSVAQVARLGLTANQDLSTLLEELHWLEVQGLQADFLLRLDATRLSNSSLAELCQCLSVRRFAFRFELHADCNACTPDVVRLFPDAGVARLVASGCAKLFALAGLEVINADDHGKSNNYGRNGFLALNTGIYPDKDLTPGIYHLEVPLTIPHERRQAAYEWAGLNMVLRSAAVLTGPRALVMENLQDLELPLVRETGGWPRHTYALAMDGNGASSVVLDGFGDLEMPVRYVPLREMASIQGQPGILTVVSIRTAEDVTALERSLRDFHAAGTIRLPRPEDNIIYENTCRWARYGNCSALLTRRVSVEEDELVLCRDAGEIGKVGDDYDQLVTLLRKEQQLAEVRRGCATCLVRDECSHCFHLPEQWGGRYCEIRKTLPLTSLYFELMAFPFLIQRYLPDATVPLIAQVAYYGLPPRHYPGDPGKPRPGARPLIITLAEQHYAWRRGTSKVIRLSEPLALMVEGWWQDANQADVVQALCNQFGADVATAESALTQGLTKLRAGGLIDG